jgi:hypothetical protein
MDFRDERTIRFKNIQSTYFNNYIQKGTLNEV